MIFVLSRKETAKLIKWHGRERPGLAGPVHSIFEKVTFRFSSRPPLVDHSGRLHTASSISLHRFFWIKNVSITCLAALEINYPNWGITVSLDQSSHLHYKTHQVPQTKNSHMITLFITLHTLESAVKPSLDVTKNKALRTFLARLQSPAFWWDTLRCVPQPSEGRWKTEYIQLCSDSSSHCHIFFWKKGAAPLVWSCTVGVSGEAWGLAGCRASSAPRGGWWHTVAGCVTLPAPLPCLLHPVRGGEGGGYICCTDQSFTG